MADAIRTAVGIKFGHARLHASVFLMMASENTYVNINRLKSVYKPSSPSGQCLSPVSVAVM